MYGMQEPSDRRRGGLFGVEAWRMERGALELELELLAALSCAVLAGACKSTLGRWSWPFPKRMATGPENPFPYILDQLLSAEVTVD